MRLFFLAFVALAAEAPKPLSDKAKLAIREAQLQQATLSLRVAEMQREVDALAEKSKAASAKAMADARAESGAPASCELDAKLEWKCDPPKQK